MKPTAKAAFIGEMALAQLAEASGDLTAAKYHLERAHILGQRWYIPHVRTHFHMLRIARRQSDAKEARGQWIRLLGATPFHIAGWVPVGNTGGADVSPTLPMPIPPDLRPHLEGHSLREGLIIRGILVTATIAAIFLISR